MANRKSKRIIRVFPRRTKATPDDETAFVGAPPAEGLFLPPADEVHISVTFSWDLPEARRLLTLWQWHYGDCVRIGGPAVTRQPGRFVPGRYLRAGITITSRGCIRHCPWCTVPRMEGSLKQLPIKAGNIIEDNNLLACSRGHIEAVFAMLSEQPRAAVFAGGLDARLLRPWHIDLLRTIRVKELWFACDSPAGLTELARVAEYCAGWRLRQKRCYVLMGFDGHDTPAAAERRCEAVLAQGFCPFAMLYQPAQGREYSPEWKKVRYKWSRPAAYLSRSEQSSMIDKP